MSVVPPALADALWHAADVAVVVSSPRGIECVTPGFERLTGIDAAAVVGRHLPSLVPDAARDAMEMMLAVVASGGAGRPQDVSLPSAAGDPIPVSHTCRLVDTDAGPMVVSTFMPSGDVQRLADVLVASEQRYRDLFEEDTDGRFVVSPDWKIIDCNGILARTLGYQDRAPLMGRSLLELTPDGPILQKLLAITRVEGKAGPVELQMERSDGSRIDMSCLVYASLGANRTLVSLRGQMAEISERKRLETRLQGAERMEAIGRLAGGLAHDFNNLLTVIRGNTERLIEALPELGPLKNAVLSIDQAAGRAAMMTQQLLAYGRRQVFEMRPLSLETLVTDIQPLLAEIVGDHIRVKVAVRNALPQINADPRQIEQVLSNLAMNAREAMRSGGVLSIRVDAMDVPDHAPRQHVWLRPGSYVRLIVSDNGHGMDPVTRAYAFQPFFTTKHMGNGRGLGLATVYGIMKQSHGFVWVDSEVDAGATFTLLFPAIKPGADAGETAVATPHETILVVEADAALREFAVGSLRRRGYHVIDAATGEAALDLFASHPSRVHLVLSDSRAVAQGTPLIGRLQSIDPMVQSLVMLEPSAEGDGQRRVLPTTPAIQKPFTLQALADKVREVLDSGEGRGRA